MIEDAKRCACGSMMVPAKLGSTVVFCPNCDALQSTEYTGDDSGRGFRTPTVQDRRFNLSWAQRIREYYGPKAA